MPTYCNKKMIRALERERIEPPDQRGVERWEQHLRSIREMVQKNVAAWSDDIKVEWDGWDRSWVISVEVPLYLGDKISGAENASGCIRKWAQLPAGATVTEMIDAARLLLEECFELVKDTNAGLVRVRPNEG